MTQRIPEISPRTLARMAAVLGVLEGVASVNGQLRIPGRLVVTTDTAATAGNIPGNESMFRLGLAVCVLAVAFNSARTVLPYVLFRPVGRIAASAFWRWLLVWATRRICGRRWRTTSTPTTWRSAAASCSWGCGSWCSA